MDYYGYGGRSEEQRRKQEEQREKNREAMRRYWANITPEQREERKRKAAETRKASREAEEARQARARSYRERAQKAAATRRRNNGTEHLSAADLEWRKIEKRREYQAAYKKRAAAKRKERRAAEREIRMPTVWRNVPGDPKGSKPHEFRGIASYILYRRNEKFWAYVDQSGGDDACWPWHGNYYYDHLRGEMSKYGAAYFERGYSTGAHRASWMLTHGVYIPGYLVVDHLCNTPWCVNPDHLEVVTQGENNRRTHHREPEITRQSTSSVPPWNDRWYPFGRRKYDENGELKEKYRDYDIDDDKIPPLPFDPDDYPADRHIHFPREPLDPPSLGFGPGAVGPAPRQEPIGGYVNEEPLLADDEEF